MGRVEVLLAALHDLGMSASRAAVAELIDERVQWVSSQMGSSPAAARRYLTDDALADLARTMAFSVADETPGADVIESARTAAVPLPILGRCIAGLAEAIQIRLRERDDVDHLRTTVAQLAHALSAVGQVTADATSGAVPGTEIPGGATQAVVMMPPGLVNRAARYLEAAAVLVHEGVRKTVLPGLLSEHHPGAVQSHVTGANASAAGFVGGVTRQRVERFPMEPSLRSEVEALTDALRPHQTGVLISLDEVHTAALEDLRQITQAVQHAFREGRELAFVAAGLPSAVQDVLNDELMTFLRRAERFTLGAVSVDDVKQALLRPIEASGRTITPTALKVAAEGTKGYPFLVQLVGHQVWNVDRGSRKITEEHARVGVEKAARRVGRLVHEPALVGLSTVDRTFLAAMAVDDGPSQMSAIADRLGADTNYVSQYRLRLIAAELIEATGHGRVDFTLPYLRDYLREHVTAVALGEDPALLRGSDDDRGAPPPGGTDDTKTIEAEADSPEHDGQ